MSTLIVIDGADGAGKATQVELLVARLRSEGRQVEQIDFPQYKNNVFGKLLRECLDGERGDFMSLDPKIASTLYAADRFESSKQIEGWLAAGTIVIADRYVSANMLHQGAKCPNEETRKEFLNWLNTVEHSIFAVPKPDIVLYLDVPYSVRQGLMRVDNSRSSLDVAETNDSHQEATEKSAQAIVASLNSWLAIPCTENGTMRSREEIHQAVYEAIKKVI